MPGLISKPSSMEGGLAFHTSRFFLFQSDNSNGYSRRVPWFVKEWGVPLNRCIYTMFSYIGRPRQTTQSQIVWLKYMNTEVFGYTNW